MKIQIKLPDYCKSTNDPKLKVVEVSGLPEKWLPTYDEIAMIMGAILQCKEENDRT